MVNETCDFVGLSQNMRKRSNVCVHLVDGFQGEGVNEFEWI